MTGNPSHDEAIVDMVRKVQMSQGKPVYTHQMEAFIRGLGYHDAGRELRRLFDAGRIMRIREGVWGTRATMCPNSLALFI
jgi:hypothetical protein